MVPAAFGLAAVMLAAAVGGGCSDPTARAETSPPKPEPPQAARETPIRIRIIAADRTLTAVLDDNETARDFASLLPLTLSLADYNETEKVADLPRNLSTADAPEGADPDVGDIAYYAPWGNLAIYYRDFTWSRGLVRLGRLEGGAAALNALGDASVRLELIQPD